MSEQHIFLVCRRTGSKLSPVQAYEPYGAFDTQAGAEARARQLNNEMEWCDNKNFFVKTFFLNTTILELI